METKMKLYGDVELKGKLFEDVRFDGNLEISFAYDGYFYSTLDENGKGRQASWRSSASGIILRPSTVIPSKNCVNGFTFKVIEIDREELRKSLKNI